MVLPWHQPWLQSLLEAAPARLSIRANGSVSCELIARFRAEPNDFRQQLDHLRSEAGISGPASLIANVSPVVSVISVVEVLGYHKLSDDDRLHFEKFFAAAQLLPVSDPVVARAVTIRQARKVSLGDSLIAATALVFGHELHTHNVKDYVGIPGLAVTDPIAAGDPR
jgi:predicted nucleic acid-binding protein